MSSDNITQPTGASVAEFLESVDHPVRRADAAVLLEMMRRITGEKPVMWGDSIVGFGQYHYRYASGREGDFMRTGFSPRKANTAIYIMPGFDDFTDELARLGAHKTGRSCLYITQLKRVDMDVLDAIIAKGWRMMGDRYPV